jgi:uncharacterized protein YrrD
MLRNIEDLHGFTIEALDGDIGAVTDCYFDDVSYAVRYVLVDTGRWLSGRKVLLSPLSFRALDWEHRRISVALTKAQVEASPAIDTQEPVSRQHETIYFGHYGRAPYWAGTYLWGASPYPYPAPGPAPSAAELERERRWNWETMDRNDPRLRSCRETTGHHVRATDGEVGHVRDFLMDDRSWAIRDLLVDTTNWWPGEKVVVAPEWIERVDWDHSTVHVTVTRAEIKNSPAYDPYRPSARAHEGGEDAADHLEKPGPGHDGQVRGEDGAPGRGDA